MKENRLKGTESKDKIITEKRLHKMVSPVGLQNIQGAVCDGTSTGNKSFCEIVNNDPKFKNVFLVIVDGIKLNLCQWTSKKNFWNTKQNC